jgi:hypothetical protein
MPSISPPCELGKRTSGEIRVTAAAAAAAVIDVVVVEAGVGRPRQHRGARSKVDKGGAE